MHSIQNRNLSLTPVQGLETPLAGYTGWALGEKIGLAPILRAGIQMTDGELADACLLLSPRTPPAEADHVAAYRRPTMDEYPVSSRHRGNLLPGYTLPCGTFRKNAVQRSKIDGCGPQLQSDKVEDSSDIYFRYTITLRQFTTKAMY